MGPEGMGYDRGVTVFSPDGRLFQVQYAMEAVRRGATVVGIKTKTGVVMVADRKVLHHLIMARSIEKVYEVDKHICAATIGLVADGRKLVDQARLEAQRHQMVYGEPITLKQLVHEISSYMQVFTQYGGVRPFGVTTLIAGYDHEPKLFEIDPSGTPTEWASTAVGEGRSEIMKLLEVKYSQSLSLEAGLKLGVEAQKHFLKNKFEMSRIEAAYVTKDGFRKADTKEIEAVLDGKA
ncbi:MAG TPA: archaeal proteasome endopeptidase complex subunit alpha [archaeon]|nr:archaeal proteasome endopeptidase complex subunit alpha [archaeon]